MSLKSLLRDRIGSLSRRGFSFRRGRSASAAELDLDPKRIYDADESEESCWANIPPELLRDVVRRLEESESAWPRKHVVACASVCRTWRYVCKEIAGMPEICAELTFPVSLKQPGPRSGPIQCYIKRNKASSTYRLYLGLNTESGKFLLAARKIKHPASSEYLISLHAEDISRYSNSYMGKLRSNFLGTKFTVYDSQPPCHGVVTSSGRSSRRFYSRKISPKVLSGSYGIADVAYEVNMFGTRGPRRMHCTMHSIPSSALEPHGSVPCYTDLPTILDEPFPSISHSQPMGNLRNSKSVDSSSFSGSILIAEVSVDPEGKGRPLILKNKPPRWHEQLQCWCLNFRGRVTVASVKNFQLTAVSEETRGDAGAGDSQLGSSDPEKVILQFGKIGKDLFTMDYQYPLSAFQAFGICLSSFDAKLACE